MFFMETWMHTDFPDHGASVPWMDRDVTLSGKRKGGGIVVVVNERWCNSKHVTTEGTSLLPGH